MASGYPTLNPAPDIFGWLEERESQANTRRALEDLDLNSGPGLISAARQIMKGGTPKDLLTGFKFLEAGHGLLEQERKRNLTQSILGGLGDGSQTQAPPQYAPALRSNAERTGLPEDFLTKLTWAESRFNPNAVSPAGARGISQFMPATAKQYGVNVRDPADSIRGSADFLKDLSDKYGGNLGLTAAAYNAGPGRVDAWLAGRSSLPEETQRYVQTITGQSADKWRQERSEPMSGPGRIPQEAMNRLNYFSRALAVSEDQGMREMLKKRIEIEMDAHKLNTQEKEAMRRQLQSQAFTATQQEQTQGFQRSERQAKQEFETEQTFTKEDAERLSKTRSEYNKEAMSARGVINSMNVAEQVVGNPQFYSGPQANTVQNLTRYASPLKNMLVGLGANPEGPLMKELDKASTTSTLMTTFNSATKEAVLNMLGGKLGAQISDADRNFVTDIMPRLEANVEANKALVMIQKKMAQRKQEVARVAREYKGRSPDELEDTVDKYAQSKPLFTKDEMDSILATVKGKPAAPINQGKTPGGFQWSIGTP